MRGLKSPAGIDCLFFKTITKVFIADRIITDYAVDVLSAVLYNCKIVKIFGMCVWQHIS